MTPEVVRVKNFAELMIHLEGEPPMSRAADPMRQTAIRIPIRLYDKLRYAMGENGSVSEEIRFRLEQSFLKGLTVTDEKTEKMPLDIKVVRVRDDDLDKGEAKLAGYLENGYHIQSVVGTISAGTAITRLFYTLVREPVTRMTPS